MVNFDMAGKVAVITGGSGTLCSVIAKELACAGVKCAVVGLHKERAVKVAQEICEAEGDAEGFGCDVLDKNSVIKCRDQILARYETVDILINGAGGNKPAATTNKDNVFFDIPEEHFKWVFDLNLTGTILPTQVFGKVFAEKGEGCIINVSSMAAFTPLTNTFAYSAAKAAISNFTQWMAVHFSQEYSTKIRVNAIAPGFFHTNQNHYLLFDEDGNQTRRGGQIIANTPMGRYGEPVELAGAVIFLCSDAASFITGVVLPIDGGFSAYAI